MLTDLLTFDTPGGLDEVFGLTRARAECLFNHTNAAAKEEWENGSDNFCQSRCLKNALSIAESEREELYIIYTLGQKIGHIKEKLQNPLAVLFA